MLKITVIIGKKDSEIIKSFFTENSIFINQPEFDRSSVEVYEYINELLSTDKEYVIYTNSTHVLSTLAIGCVRGWVNKEMNKKHYTQHTIDHGNLRVFDTEKPTVNLMKDGLINTNQIDVLSEILSNEFHKITDEYLETVKHKANW